MANTRLTRTAGTPTLNTKFTISVWVKRSSLGADQFIMDGRQDASNRFKLAFQSANKLEIWNSHGGSDTFAINTNRTFRDTSNWMHILLAVDTTDGTAGDRVKLYINGVRETSFSSSTNPSQNDANNVINENGAGVHIGDYSGGSNAFSGCMSHFHFCDGTALAPTVFGSTDSVTGEWQINTSPSFTLGTNGFTILKDGNTITDQSSNSNDFSLASGTLTPTEDCPSDSFATFNNLIAQTGATFANGNTFVYRSSAGNVKRIGCTIGATSGKYYAEFQLGTNQWGGVCLTNGGDIARTEAGSNGYMGEYAADKSVGVRQDGIVYSSGANVSSAQWNQGSLGATDKLCLALDLDNKKLFLGKNGVWSSSSNPASNTGGITLTGDSYTFCGATDNADCKINTGNGYFGTDAISSEGSNASGIGKFEYDVPTGFTALSTKGLNE
nr:spry domain protein [uncultured Mediterranean phage uvMED]